LNRLQLLALLVVLFAGTGPAALRADDTEITVGVLAFRGEELARARWAPTTDYLTSAVPGYTFRLVPLDLHAMHDSLERGELDFVLTNPGNYVELESEFGITRIATLKNVREGQVYKEFGAVIFTRADRDDIRELADLRHTRFAAVDREAFGGFQMAWRELSEAGIDPFRDLGELRFVGFPQDQVVLQVRDGAVDAGTVRTDVLERMAGQGLIRIEEFRILNPHVTEGFPFRHSTRLYPEWTFAKAKRTPDEVAKAVTLALLSMPSDHPAAIAGRNAGWTVPLDYQRVHELFKALRIGPYKHFGEFTLGGFLRRYWYGFAALLAVLGFSLFHNIRVERLVDQRTAELRRTNRALEAEVSERKRAEEESRSLLKENRFLIRKSLAVQEEERRHLGRRDSLIDTSVKAILEVSAHLYDVVHHMIQRARPGVLDDLGLVVALEDLVNDCRTRFPGIVYQLNTRGELGTLGEQINITLYRIVQECLTNIAKHAGATRVSIELAAGAEWTQHAGGEVVTLGVRDNGRGMEPAGNGRGLGIAGMRERVEALGGRFTVQGTPGGGVTVSAVIPLSTAATQAA
jgi:ABC-type phosphate/phosphonate transport system substrate-binding protein